MTARKLVTMTVTVSVPVCMSPAFARREVRHLITDGVGYMFNAGDEEGARFRSIKAASQGRASPPKPRTPQGL